MPEEVTLKTIRDRRRKFFLASAWSTTLISTILIIAAFVYLKFLINAITGFLVIWVAYLTFQTINRIYMDKVGLTRTVYIQRIFPIKETLTKEQYLLIMSDLDYMFDKFNREPEDDSNNQKALSDLYHKIKTNNLTVRDIEKFNIIYSNHFVDLTNFTDR